MLTPSLPEPQGEALLDSERRTVAAMKKVALMVLGTAMQTFGDKLTDEQEILSATADIVIDVYAAESVVLRAISAGDSSKTAALQQDAASVFVSDAAGRVAIAARTALSAMSEGDNLRTLLAALRRILKPVAVNTVALRRRVADAVVSGTGYPF
jgi:alkylation response protein AidB-like acyl-CoA dehydrogenase